MSREHLKLTFGITIHGKDINKVREDFRREMRSVLRLTKGYRYWDKKPDLDGSPMADRHYTLKAWILISNLKIPGKEEITTIPEVEICEKILIFG